MPVVFYLRMSSCGAWHSIVLSELTLDDYVVNL